jgi:hypothetical protein
VLVVISSLFLLLLGGFIVISWIPSMNYEFRAWSADLRAFLIRVSIGTIFIFVAGLLLRDSIRRLRSIGARSVSEHRNDRT